MRLLPSVSYTAFPDHLLRLAPVTELQRTIDEMKSKYDKCFCDLQVAEEEKLKAQNLVLSREQELRELRVCKCFSPEP